jgi:hypothetical protein
MPPLGGLRISWARVKGEPKSPASAVSATSRVNAKESAVRRDLERGAGKIRALGLRFTLNIRSVRQSLTVINKVDR